VDRRAQEENAHDVPCFLKCPLTGRLFNDPVVAGDGYTYERSAIEERLRSQCISPVTRLPMENSCVYPARTIRNMAEIWSKRRLAAAWRARSSGRENYDAPQASQTTKAVPPTIPPGDFSLNGACIGRGTFKTVYRGAWGGREVAVSSMARGATLDAELHAVMKVGSHPHILQVHGVSDVADDPSRLHIISELAPMGSLSDIVSRGKETGEIRSIASPVILVIAMQICEAMIAVTRAGIVHRDLGARNILAFEFASNQYFSVHVKLADFGMAIPADTSPERLGHLPLRVHSDEVTPLRYMAPEALRSNNWSEKTDVWAFGVMLWELTSMGRIPYEHVVSDDALAAGVCSGSLRLHCSPSTRGPLADIISTCWALDPANRPSFSQLQKALNSLALEWRMDESFCYRRLSAEASASLPQAASNAAATGGGRDATPSFVYGIPVDSTNHQYFAAGGNARSVPPFSQQVQQTSQHGDQQQHLRRRQHLPPLPGHG